MVIKNIKKISRVQKLDISGHLFLKSKLRFRFIKKWIYIFEEDMLKIERVFPEILEELILKKKNKEFLYRHNFYKLTKAKQENFLKRRPFNYNVNLEQYDLDIEFKQYFIYFKYKKNIKRVLKYLIRYDQINKRRFFFSKRLFKQKQRLKVFWNLKEKQIKKIIFKLNKNKFKFLDFYFYLEYRLDMILYRAFFFETLQHAQQFIKNYGIYINNKYINIYNYIVKIGDKIEISKNINALIYIYFLLKNIILIPLVNYIEVNYNTLNIIVKSFFIYQNKHLKKTLFVNYNRLKTFTFYNKPLKKKYYNFLVFKKKKYKLLTKQSLYFNTIQKFASIYYPFKVTLKDFESIFQLY